MNPSAFHIAVSLSLLFSTASVSASDPIIGSDKAVKVRTNQLRSLKEKPSSVVETQQKPPASSSSSTYSEPVNLDARRIATFTNLYNLYLELVGKYAKPGVIEWFRVSVHSWPFPAFTTNIADWSEEDLDLLDFLISENLLKFEFSSKLKRKHSEFLELPKSEEEVKEEEIPSKRAKKSASIKKISAKSSSSDDDESFKSEASLEYESESDSTEASFTSEFEESKPAIAVSTRSKRLNNPASSKKSKGPRKGKMSSNFKNVKVVSDAPADTVRRDDLLKRVLKIYRKQTGDSLAQEINWDRFKVIYLQNHRVPFSFGLETEGDCATLENLMKNRHFGFINLSNKNDLRILIYARIYRLYYEAVGVEEADPFVIKWGQISIIGWPKQVAQSYSHWTIEEIKILEALLDQNSLIFVRKNGEKANADSSDSNSEEEEEEEQKPVKSAKKLKRLRRFSGKSTADYSTDEEDNKLFLNEMDEEVQNSHRYEKPSRSIENTVLLVRGNKKTKFPKIHTSKVLPYVRLKITKRGIFRKSRPTFRSERLKEQNATAKKVSTEKFSRKKVISVPVKVIKEKSAANKIKREKAIPVPDIVSFETDTVDEIIAEKIPSKISVRRTVTVKNSKKGKKIMRVPAEERESSVSAHISEISFDESLKASPEVLQELLAGLNESIEAFDSAKVDFQHNARHNRIIAEIIRCYELIRDNVDAIIKKDASLAPSLGFVELERFLTVFKEALAAIEPSGKLKNSILRKFIIERVNFHGRIAGIGYKTPTASSSSSQNLNQLKITSDRLIDPEAYHYLMKSGAIQGQYLEILELVLDDSSHPIFK